MANKVDVRILRSKDSLMSSLVGLMLDHDISEITISQLCQEAKVNRNTFYSHFSDVSALFDELKGKYLESVLSSLSSGETSSPEKKLHMLLEKLKAEGDVSRVIITSSNGFDYLKTLVKFCLSLYDETNERDVADKESLYSFLLGGVSNLIYDWVTKGFPSSSSVIEKKIIFFTEKYS